MRIRTRLFLATAALVLALVGVQGWLHVRQVRALQEETARVAASVGEQLVLAPFLPRAWRLQSAPAGQLAGSGGDTPPVTAGAPEPRAGVEERRFTWVRRDDVVASPASSPPKVVLLRKVLEREDAGRDEAGTGGAPVTAQRIEMRVEATRQGSESVLVIDDGHGVHRIAIPATASKLVVRRGWQQGLLASAGVLVVGLCGAALLAHRVTRPLADLAHGLDAVAAGQVGAQVRPTGRGEVGELQGRFNAMSRRLAELEAERDGWRAREHLAQLGELARGLAHTLRNPLNTLGLSMEELAAAAGQKGASLAGTARAQIRRIDRWLVSFLALGANGAAEPEVVDVADVVREVALESAQQGHPVVLAGRETLHVRGVSRALRAALANLVENAVDASPPGEQVTITLGRAGAMASVAVADRGPGLPPEVRERLFTPHVTTKAGGSGMGLFLARQLLVVGHGGTLELGERPGVGTVAEVRLPLAESGA